MVGRCGIGQHIIKKFTDKFLVCYLHPVLVQAMIAPTPTDFCRRQYSNHNWQLSRPLPSSPASSVISRATAFSKLATPMTSHPQKPPSTTTPPPKKKKQETLIINHARNTVWCTSSSPTPPRHTDSSDPLDQVSETEKVLYNVLSESFSTVLCSQVGHVYNQFKVWDKFTLNKTSSTKHKKKNILKHKMKNT